MNFNLHLFVDVELQLTLEICLINAIMILTVKYAVEMLVNWSTEMETI